MRLIIRDQGMPAYLFVYGTLLPWAVDSTGRVERTELARAAFLLGKAAVNGTLVDLGMYPGFADGNGIVHGALYRLPDGCAPLLAWLDAYEGVTGGVNEDYVRVERPVTCSDGTRVRGWVYVYRGPLDGKPVIAGGSWGEPGEP